MSGSEGDWPLRPAVFHCTLADDGSGGTLVSLPSPCGSECSTNTLVSCMSSLPTDPQSPQSPSHIPSSIPCVPNSTPVPTSHQIEGNTYTIPQHSSEPQWDSCEGDKTPVADGTHAISVSGTLTGLMNTVSGMMSKTSHTTVSSGVLGTAGPENTYSQVSRSNHTHSSHSASSLAVETPLVRTSDLSDHSDGSDETVTSGSRRCSEVEEK